ENPLVQEPLRRNSQRLVPRDCYSRDQKILLHLEQEKGAVETPAQPASMRQSKRNDLLLGQGNLVQGSLGTPKYFVESSIVADFEDSDARFVPRTFGDVCLPDFKILMNLAEDVFGPDDGSFSLRRRDGNRDARRDTAKQRNSSALHAYLRGMCVQISTSSASFISPDRD